MKKTESCLFEMINNIDKLLARLTKRKKVQVINIKNERDDTTSQHQRDNKGRLQITLHYNYQQLTKQGLIIEKITEETSLK